jgi:phospholipid/cholesterol/gamma-HCH transport system ATP-binding protein
MIELKNLVKAFGTRTITKSLNLKVPSGTFMAIIGRSGEGKSVLLKQIIGLIKPDSGNVIIDNEDITTMTKKQREKIFKKCGYVFQFAALLDSLNVLNNIGITLYEQGKKEKEIKPLVLEKIKSVGLRDDTLEKFPDELSGGMKKRVGLARTLMLSPEILIYDEPTTGLDPIAVKLIHELIKKTHKQLNATTIVISHDIAVFDYADTVAMLHEGKIAYTGPTKDIWECDNPYVHQFIRGLSEGPIK